MNDAISRSELLEKFEEARKSRNNTITDIIFLDAVITMIKDAPGVEVEPEWIDVEDGLPRYSYECLIRVRRHNGYVYNAVGVMECGVWRISRELYTDEVNGKVIKWMPIPSWEEGE